MFKTTIVVDNGKFKKFLSDFTTFNSFAPHTMQVAQEDLGLFCLF